MSVVIQRRFHVVNRRGLKGGCRRIVRPGREPAPDPIPMPPPVPAPPRVHPLARRMAMAIRCQQLIDSGVAVDQASLAAVAGMTRARITQIMRLNMLAPEIQEWILFLVSENDCDGVELQRTAGFISWDKQRLNCQYLSRGYGAGRISLRQKYLRDKVGATKGESG